MDTPCLNLTQYCVRSNYDDDDDDDDDDNNNNNYYYYFFTLGSKDPEG